MQPSRSEYVAIRHRRYHVRIWGHDDAPTLFMLHGWGDAGISFQFVVDELAGDWRIVAPDWRGFGLSQWNEGPYYFLDYLADLDALLDAYSPNEPARIAGHSLGGIVGSVYAGARPERVARLATLEGFGLWVAEPAESPARLARWLDQIHADDARFRSYDRPLDFARRMMHDNPRLTAERADFLAEHLLEKRDDGFVFSGDPRHRWNSPALFPLADAMACWRKVEAPTLWVGGRESRIMRSFAGRPADYAERMACFRRLNEVIIDDCGHNLHHDQPARLAQLLSGFFSHSTA